MFRRLVVLGAVCIAALVVPVIAPPMASASPTQVTAGQSLYATTELTLPDGRSVQASLSRYRTLASPSWSAYLSLSVQTPCAAYPCPAPSSVSTPLAGSQVRFDLTLTRASVQNLPVVLESSSWDPVGGYVVTRTPVTVSLSFVGTGRTSSQLYRGDVCGDGSTDCFLSLRLDTSRAASASIVLGQGTATVSAVGTGMLYRGGSLDVQPTPTQGS